MIAAKDLKWKNFQLLLSWNNGSLELCRNRIHYFGLSGVKVLVKRYLQILM
jgi:hypothetical protein